MVRIAPGVALALVVACVACGAVTPPAASAPPRTDVAATAVTASATPTSAASPASSASSPVLRIALTDVRTGERFTLDGFAGKTVIVEGMAVW